MSFCSLASSPENQTPLAFCGLGLHTTGNGAEMQRQGEGREEANQHPSGLAGSLRWNL